MTAQNDESTPAAGAPVERPVRPLVERLRDVVPEHGWAVVNTKTEGIVIWFSARREVHPELKARTWLQEHLETHRTHEVRPYKDRCLEHEAADEIERLREVLVQLQQWADAYQLEVFPEPLRQEWQQANEVLSQAGLSMTRMSASNMRHVISGVRKLVDEGLKA